MRIDEARRNPDRNPKIDILTELTKYGDDDDFFVSFTSGFNYAHKDKPIKSGPRSKIGVNPQSGYNTPLGIYCYPLKYVVEYSKREGKVTAPFTGGYPWKFLYVLRRKKIGYIETDADAEPYYENLKTMVMEFFPEEDYARNFILSAEESAKEETPRGNLWNLARILSQNTDFKEINGFNKSPVAWNYIMRTIGCMQWVDRKNQGLIHSNEPTQSVFFSATNFNVVDVFPSPKNQVLTNENFDKIISAVVAGKFNADNFDPLWIKKLGVSSDQFVPVLDFLDKNVKAVQRKAIGAMIEDVIDTYYISDVTNTLRLANKFADISPAIPQFTYVYMKLPDLADIERVMGRKMTNPEWNAIIISAMENGWANIIKSSFNNEAEFVTEFMKRWVDFPKKFYSQDVGVDFIADTVKKFNIKFTDKQLVRLFYKVPEFALDAYPELASRLRPQDWVRASRTSGFGVIAREAPIESLKIILSAMGNSNRVFPLQDSQVAIKRLIEAGEDDYALWVLLNDRNLGVYAKPEIVEFIWRNINKLISKMNIKSENSRYVLDFVAGQEMPPSAQFSETSMKKLWATMNRARARGIEALYHMLSKGVITVGEMKAHSNNEVVGKLYDQALRGDGIFAEKKYKFLSELDLEYLFHWADQSMKAAYIHPHHLIEYFSRPAVEKYDRVSDWAPLRNWEYPRGYMEKLVHIIPDMFRNHRIYEYLDPHVLYGGVIDGSIDYSSLPEREQGVIWSSLLKEDLGIFDKIYYDPRFHPVPRYAFSQLTRPQRAELFGRPMPAAVVAKCVSGAEGYEFTVKPNEEQQLIELLLTHYQSTIDVAIGRIKISNISTASLYKIQRAWLDRLFKQVAEKTQPQMILPMMKGYLKNILDATKIPTQELKAYVGKLISAIDAQDIGELRSLGQNEIANLIPSQA